ncbi:cupredoxin domain-containing protein [Candidatus Roizmanbacteria bacterium]|nr:cupredoxin domain-containing protein [Candidatus Roizmanbacteria bacterium]
MEENTAPKGSMTPLLIGVGVLIVLAGGFFLFRSNNTPSQMREESPETMMEEPTATDEMMEEGMTEKADENPAMENEESMMEEDVVEIDMEAGSFSYTPDEITVKQGQTVRINLTAVDMMHDLNIDELNVDGPVVENGQSTTIEFVADQVGEFEYYCSVGQHRANGQVGTLIVEE